MNFENAIKCLKMGKKVRRKRWIEGHHWVYGEGEIFDSNGTLLNDWEELKDDWNLQTFLLTGDFGNKYFAEKSIQDLKLKLLEDVEKMDCHCVNRIKIQEIINKRFGF